MYTMGFRTLPQKLKNFQFLYNLVLAHYDENKDVPKKKKKARAKHVVRVMKKTQDLTEKARWSPEDTALAVAAACVHDVAKFDERKNGPSHDELGEQWVRKNRYKICQCLRMEKYNELFAVCDTVLWHKKLYPPQAGVDGYYVDENGRLRNKDDFIKLTWNKSLLIGLVVRAADKIDKERTINCSEHPRKAKRKVVNKIKDALNSFPESNETTLKEQKRIRKQIKKEMKRIKQDYYY